MKEQISVHFGLSPEEQAKFGETLLREIGYADDSRFGVIMRFKSDDARLAQVRVALRKYGVKFGESLLKLYSSAELLQFPLLLLGVKGLAGAGSDGHRRPSSESAYPTSSAGADGRPADAGHALPAVHAPATRIPWAAGGNHAAACFDRTAT